MCLDKTQNTKPAHIQVSALAVHCVGALHEKGAGHVQFEIQKIGIHQGAPDLYPEHGHFVDLFNYISKRAPSSEKVVMVLKIPPCAFPLSNLRR